ncbi:RNA pseudouridine synthase [Peptoanaerobacter stomatis]|uniref:RNA pseudouridylate synthase n=1 Tax=Peptoanaerobacter stomatis TaxID=796937 RepID=J4W161_9FIRM|nr:RluA family pseudouridine synthase [Peptoanaerobacter stomatis]EJU20016.1 RNA pseudouridine synthase [Peptoanaerobacter stomatis]NWO25070.1 RluA family pseudouridine synthase [Peptostreptococcaceae bacterium oral taxon 081]
MYNLNIIYEDNHIIVVDKIAGVLSQSDDSNDIDMLTLVKRYIKEKYNKPGEVFLGLVHRLDTVTSGVMVFARTSKAASRLSEQIRQNNMKKTYLAVFEEEIKQKQGNYTDYLLKDSKKNIVTVTKDKNKGKIAVLNYEVLNINKGRTLAKIELITGRSHQIRVQFSSRGYHIYGDAKYGAKNKEKKAIALHSYELSFIHPTKKEEMTFICEPKRYPFDEMI